MAGASIKDVFKGSFTLHSNSKETIPCVATELLLEFIYFALFSVWLLFPILINGNVLLICCGHERMSEEK